MNKTSEFFNIFQQPYEFFLLNEPEFAEYTKDISNNKNDPLTNTKNISTLGLIIEFDSNTFKGDLQFKDYLIKVDFSHMSSTFKWVKRFYYFIYGILEVSNIAHI